MVFYLSQGQRNEMVGFWPLMERGEVKRAGRGRPRLRPRRICALRAQERLGAAV